MAGCRACGPAPCFILTWSCRDARQAANGLDPVARAARRGLGSGTGWLWAKTVNLHDFHRNLLRATQCHIMPEPAAEGGWPWNEYAPPKLPPPPPVASGHRPSIGHATRSFGLFPACNHGVRRDHGFSTAPGAGVVVARASHLLVGTAPRHQSWVLRIYPCNTILHMKHASMATHQKAARRAPRLLRRRPSRAPIAQASQSAEQCHTRAHEQSLPRAPRYLWPSNRRGSHKACSRPNRRWQIRPVESERHTHYGIANDDDTRVRRASWEACHVQWFEIKTFLRCAADRLAT